MVTTEAKHWPSWQSVPSPSAILKWTSTTVPDMQAESQSKKAQRWQQWCMATSLGRRLLLRNMLKTAGLGELPDLVSCSRGRILLWLEQRRSTEGTESLCHKSRLQRFSQLPQQNHVYRCISGVARKTGELMGDVSKREGLLKLMDNVGIRTNG